MLRVLMGLAILLALAPQPVRGQGGQGASWSVVALRIEKPLPEQLKGAINLTGVEVTLLLHVPGKFVVGLDYEACKLASATDDKGTNLLEAPKKGNPPLPSFNLDYRSSATGPYFLASVLMPNRPAQGATKVRLKGSARVLCATKEKSVEVKGVSFKAGAKTAIGPATLTLDQFEIPQETSVQVRGPYPIKKLEFLDGTGKALMHFGNMVAANIGKRLEYTGVYHIRGKVDSATVRMTYFEEQEQFTVPLDVELGLGL
jgi:hypothetical protein